MILYLSTIFILFLFSIIENSTKSFKIRNYLYFISFILIVSQVGLRWETGTDWNSYLDAYSLVHSFNDTSPLITRMEYGYNYFMYLTKLIIDNYSGFLLIHAFIYLSIIFISITIYTPKHLMVVLLLFYTSTMGILGSNRQLISVSLCLIALKYARERKIIKFFSLVLIAFLVHSTALLFVIYYFIDFDIKFKKLALIMLIASIIGMTNIPFGIFSFLGGKVGFDASKVIFYLETAQEFLTENKLSIFGFVKRILFISIFYYNKDRLIGKVPYYNLMLNGYSIGLIIYFLFMNSLLIIVNRGSLYFTIMEPFLLAFQLLLIKQKRMRVVMLFVLFAYSIMMFFKSIEGYYDLFIPYKGLFINAEYNRFMY